MKIENQENDLRHYLNILLKRKWIIITIFAVMVLSAFIQARRVIPMYRGTSRIVIDQKNPNLVSIKEVMAVDPGSRYYLGTQLQIIKSRSVAEEVIRRLDLKNNPKFFPKPRTDLLSVLTRWYGSTIRSIKSWAISLVRTRPSGGGKKAGLGKDDIPPGLVNAVIGRIHVKPIEGTRLVDVHFTAPDPELAARIANEVVKAYIDLNLEIKLKTTKEAVQWLSDRVEEERKKVERAEVALLSYRDNKGILTDFSSNAESIAAQELAQIKGQVVAAESQRVGMETRYQQALALESNPDMLDSIPEIMDNDLVREVKKMEVKLYNRMSELSKKYGRNHPQMVAIQSELDELKNRMKEETTRIINSLRNDYKLAVAREQSLKRLLDQQKNRILDLNKKAIQYRVLQRQAESSKHMYDLLIRRLKETTLSEEMRTGNIRVIDRAQIHAYPVNIFTRQKVRNAMVLGLILGIGLAFLLEFLDNTIKIPEEIKKYFDIPYLGPVPIYEPEETAENEYQELITLHSPKSTASESFRGLRTNIIFSSADADPQVLLITSAGPSEGKTSCAANLAVTMAQAGSRTIVIDCDMRRPRLHTVFSAERETGISTLLVGASEMGDSIIRTRVENLDIMPSGPIPPNPSEILGSNKMQAIIDDLRKTYKRIIIDTPPITAVTDAAVLSRIVDGVIMVIRAADTPRQIVENGVAKLKGVNAHILGAVLNVVDTGKDSYYYYHHYYYYYGEDHKRTKKSRRKKKKKSDTY